MIQLLTSYVISVLVAGMLVMFAAALVGFAIGYWAAVLISWAAISIIATGVASGIAATSMDA